MRVARNLLLVAFGTAVPIAALAIDQFAVLQNCVSVNVSRYVILESTLTEVVEASIGSCEEERAALKKSIDSNSGNLATNEMIYKMVMDNIRSTSLGYAAERRLSLRQSQMQMPDE